MAAPAVPGDDQRPRELGRPARRRAATHGRTRRCAGRPRAVSVTLGSDPAARQSPSTSSTSSTRRLADRHVRGGDLAREARVRDDQVTVRGERPAARLAVQVREHERRHRLAVHALRVGRRERLLDQRLDVVEALVGRPAEQQPSAAELPVRVGDLRRLVRRLDARRHTRAAVRGVEERQRVGAPSEHRHAERLEQLRRRRHVEQRLHARRDDERRRRGEHAEVGRDVRRRRPAAVHAAEPARRHEADAGRAAHGERAADRRRADRALHEGGGRVARADLARRRRRTGASSSSVSPTTISPSRMPIVAGTAPASRTARSDASPTATPSPGGKPCATSVVSSATTPWPPSSASRTSSSNRITASPRAARSTCAAASSPASTPPTRNPAANASPAPVASTTSVGTAGCATPSTTTPSGAALHDPASSSPRLAERLALALDREDEIGRERPRPVRGTRRRSASTTRGRARSARPPPAPARRRAAPQPRPVPSSARSPTRAEHRSGTSPARARPVGAPARSRGRRPSCAARRRRSRRRRRSVRRRGRRPRRRARELASDQLAGRVVAELRHEPRLGAERCRPRGDVRSLPAGGHARRRDAVVVGRERLVQTRDHVQEQVANAS